MFKNRIRKNIDEALLTTSNLIVLNILWIIFSIPVLTIGASTTALYDGLSERKEKKIRIVIYNYISNFKNKFRKSTISWITIMSVTALFALELISVLSYSERNIEIIKYILYSGILIFFISIQYLFLLISKMYEKSLREIYYLSFFLGVRNIHWSILIILYFLINMIIFFMFQKIFIFLWPVYVLIGFSPIGYLKIRSLDKKKYSILGI